MSTYGSYNNKLQNKIDKLTLTKTVAEKYNIPLNFKVTEHIIISVFKEKILENLPKNIYQKKLGTIETLLNETLRFDSYVESNNKHIAIEIKVIETLRGLLERIGTMATIDLTKSALN